MTHASDLLSNRARLTPQREALFDQHSGRRYTFADLDERARRVANLLLEEYHIQRGDRVSILAYNYMAYVDLLFGLGKIGAVFTPLNWRLTARELAYILQNCTPAVLFVGPEFLGVLEELRAIIPLPALILLEQAQPQKEPGARRYEDLLAQATEAPMPVGEAPMPVGEAPMPVGEDDPYCILYTSGTTGNPKGAVLPHRQVFWNAVNTVISWGLTEEDAAPILTPMFHSGGLFVFLLPLVYVGGRVILTRTFDVEQSLALIVQEGCTAVLGVPTLFQLWLNSPALAGLSRSRVRFFISGGAPCSPALIEVWTQQTGIPLRQGYGLTEVGVNCFSMTNAEALPKAGSVGKPIFHSRMRLVDGQGRDVQPGETGELLISGLHVCSGYWNDPVATSAALREGWFHTGDMARQDVDGFFYIAGRFKDMIISGGENVYAAEVEAVFREHPAVADAALIGQPDEKWGEVGLMVVALKVGAQASATDLLEFCQTRLARYKIPRRVEFCDGLPYSPYGKVVKAELRGRYLKDNLQYR